MKTLLASLLVLLLVVSAGFGQTQPNGKLGTPTQGTTSLMAGGVHDFTPTGALGTSGQQAGTPTDLCGYCHRPHTLAAGMAASSPLWARASLSTHGSPTYDVYSSVSLDVVPTPLNSTSQYVDNYGSFCLSCHDGSTFLAATMYGAAGPPHGYTHADSTNPTQVNSLYAFQEGGFEDTAQQNLTHLHPVNFNYAAAVADNPGDTMRLQRPPTCG